MNKSKFFSNFLFFILILTSSNAAAITLDIFMEMQKCHKMIDLKNRAQSEKYFTCIKQYIDPKESGLVKDQIALTFFQMEKIINPEVCQGEKLKMLTSVYPNKSPKNKKNGPSFICFKSLVDGQEKESFAVFEKATSEKSWKNAKLVRLKFQ